MDDDIKKLIQDIYEITQREPLMPEIEDYYGALAEIADKIDEYYERIQKSN